MFFFVLYVCASLLSLVFTTVDAQKSLSLSFIFFTLELLSFPMLYIKDFILFIQFGCLLSYAIYKILELDFAYHISGLLLLTVMCAYTQNGHYHTIIKI